MDAAPDQLLLRLQVAQAPALVLFQRVPRQMAAVVKAVVSMMQVLLPMVLGKAVELLMLAQVGVELWKGQVEVAQPQAVSRQKHRQAHCHHALLQHSSLLAEMVPVGMVVQVVGQLCLEGVVPVEMLERVVAKLTELMAEIQTAVVEQLTLLVAASQ